MACPEFGPCEPWVTPEEVARCCADAPEGYDFAWEIELASQVLFELSRRLFPGTCDECVRPYCEVEPCVPFQPWANLNLPTCCGHGNPSCCYSVPQIKLHYPVCEIKEVLIDGVVLDPSEYRVDDNRYLVRLAESCGTNPGWPSCQCLDVPSTEVGTWEIRYCYGSQPPAIGKAAAAKLACEFFNACNGDCCELPEGTTRIVRQNVTIERDDYEGFFGAGRTGCREIDMFLGAYNPNRYQRRPAVFSPDVRPYPRRVDCGG